MTDLNTFLKTCLLFFVIFLILFSLGFRIVRADDSQFYSACGGGDLQSYVGCFGDLQNSFIGSISVDVVAVPVVVVSSSSDVGNPVASRRVGDRFY